MVEQYSMLLKFIIKFPYLGTLNQGGYHCWYRIGGIWRYLAVFGGIWRYLAVFGGIWRHLAVFGGIWRYLVFVCFMRHVSRAVVYGRRYISITAINDHRRP